MSEQEGVESGPPGPAMDLEQEDAPSVPDALVQISPNVPDGQNDANLDRSEDNSCNGNESLVNEYEIDKEINGIKGNTSELNGPDDVISHEDKQSQSEDIPIKQDYVTGDNNSTSLENNDNLYHDTVLPSDQTQTGQSASVLNLDDIQSEVMTAIHESSGFLDSDSPSVSSDPPSTSDIGTPQSSPCRASQKSTPNESNSFSNTKEDDHALSPAHSDADTLHNEPSKAHTQSSEVQNASSQSCSSQQQESQSSGSSELKSGSSEHSEDQLLSELDEALQTNAPSSFRTPNGLKLSTEGLSDFIELKAKCESLQQTSVQQQEHLQR